MTWALPTLLLCGASALYPGVTWQCGRGVWGDVCPVRARRATFLLTIPASARDLPSDGEGPPNGP